MPTSRAIAAAVSPLSPVTTLTRMPGPVNLADRRGDLGPWRVEHRGQAEQAQIPFGVRALAGNPAIRRGRRRQATASTRSPRRA